MTTVNITEARDGLATLFNRVAFGHDRIVIERRGKDRVAMVPIEDLELLEHLEDAMDLQTIRDRMDEPSEPWEKVKTDLGL